uniref:Uncharacterized protein n=1 Tax=Cacopsylla melanoneura TaxID=428564 RepID=A0A8D9AL21_9HEMI
MVLYFFLETFLTQFLVFAELRDMSELKTTETLDRILNEWFTGEFSVPHVHIAGHVLALEHKLNSCTRYISRFSLDKRFPIQTLHVSYFEVPTVNIFHNFFISDLKVHIFNNSGTGNIIRRDKGHELFLHLLALNNQVCTLGCCATYQELTSVQSLNINNLITLVSYLSNQLGQ